MIRQAEKFYWQSWEDGEEREDLGGGVVFEQGPEAWVGGWQDWGRVPAQRPQQGFER